MNFLRPFRERRKRNNFIDLHLHSNRQGGIISPREIALYIHHLYKKGKKIQKVALTDHETLEGQEEFSTTLRSLDFGEDTPEIYWGAEVSLLLEPKERTKVHLLIYSPSKRNPLFYLRENAEDIFNKLNGYMHTRNSRRAMQMIKLLAPSCELTMEDFYAHAQFGRYLSNLSLIRALRETGHFTDGADIASFMRDVDVSNANGHFDSSNWPRADEFIPMLGKRFEYVSFAHPVLTNTRAGLDTVIEKLVSLGVNAMEISHPSNSAEQTMELDVLARKFNLYQTAGSDEHFYKQPYRIGVPMNTLDPTRLI